MFIVKLLQSLNFSALVVCNNHMAVFPKSENAEFSKNPLVFL